MKGRIHSLKIITPSLACREKLFACYSGQFQLQRLKSLIGTRPPQPVAAAMCLQTIQLRNSRLTTYALGYSERQLHPPAHYNDNGYMFTQIS